MDFELPDSDRFLAGDYMMENPMYSEREVRKFIEQAVTVEREACAKLCDDLDNEGDGIYGNECAYAIRMRSNVQIEGLAATKRGRSPGS
jgi:hypothetical protein